MSNTRLGTSPAHSRAHRLTRVLLLCAVLVPGCTFAQMQPPPPGPLDPARNAKLRPAPASHETAQFIWTANDAAAHDPALQARVRGQNDKTEPHFFRAHFHVDTVPRAATLYLAGPRSATVFLNGHEVLHATDDGTRPRNLSVLTADVASALHPGDNTLAIEEVRGHSSLHTGASPTINQITYGEVLAVKIVPAPLAVDAPPILVSDTHWRSILTPAANWQSPTFDDHTWPQVEGLGVLGSKRDFLQWNADAGLYAWPGYSGISSALRVFNLAPVSATPSGNSILLDFGREISARLRLTSIREHHDRRPGQLRRVPRRSTERQVLPWHPHHHRPATRQRVRPQERLPLRQAHTPFRHLSCTTHPGRRGHHLSRPIRGQLHQLRPRTQPHLRNRRLHRPPLHAGRHLGRRQARSRPLDG